MLTDKAKDKAPDPVLDHIEEARKWYDALRTAHNNHNMVDADMLLAVVGSLLFHLESKKEK